MGCPIKTATTRLFCPMHGDTILNLQITVTLLCKSFYLKQKNVGSDYHLHVLKRDRTIITFPFTQWKAKEQSFTSSRNQ